MKTIIITAVASLLSVVSHANETNSQVAQLSEQDVLNYIAAFENEIVENLSEKVMQTALEGPYSEWQNAKIEPILQKNQPKKVWFAYADTTASIDY